MKMPFPPNLTLGLLGMLLLVSASLPFADAEFGDYADPSFSCPFTTTCNQVCVVSVSDCPVEMMCGVTEMLCADGSCAESCDPDLETPCAFECAPVACAQVIDLQTNCIELYGSLYDAEAECGELEVEEATNLYTYKEPIFVFFYSWFSIIPILLILWCAYNQRTSPVPGSCKALQTDIGSGNHGKKDHGANISDLNDHTMDNLATEEEGREAISWQTGYKYHPVGGVINLLTVLNLLLIQGLLGWLVVQYYKQQEANFFPWAAVMFDDEVQVLLVFELVWMYGFVWNFSLKFPYSVRTMHLRRCFLREATHVAVCMKKTDIGDGTEPTLDISCIASIGKSFSKLFNAMRSALSFIFSDANIFGLDRRTKAVFKVCLVQVDADGARYFTFLFRRYNLDMGEDKFIPGNYCVGNTIGEIMDADSAQGLSSEEVKARRQIVGRNVIEMEKPNLLRVAKREFSKPFYVYQFFLVWSWLPLWYYYMAFTWLLVILGGGFTVIVFRYRNDRDLYRLTVIEGEIDVLRDGSICTIPQDQLVPGDIVSVSSGVTFCDMVLMEATRTVVDESALTGEATPVGKTPVDPIDRDQKYTRSAHKRHTISAGTKVMESEVGRGIVMTTASYTARGELISDILAYKRHQFKFDIEVPIVLTILFCYAIFGWGIAYHWTGDIFVYGWFYGIYVIATVLPPLLPTVFTISVGVSDNRLARKRIACTHPESILVAGKVTRAFFDKTGTLTKQGLDFVSARGMSDWIDESKSFAKEVSVSLASDKLSLGMAVCHSLTPSSSGDLAGNPVDKVMFLASRGKIAHVDGNSITVNDQWGHEVKIIKHFDFDYHRMTQSVIIQDKSGKLTAFVKGSGESLQKLCRAETLPQNFDYVLRESAKRGIYQISMASKSISTDADLTSITRDEVETDLHFEGVVNFKNVIRETTSSVIAHLEEGGVTSIMITGDSVLTGVAIAREAGIIKSDKSVLIGSLSDGNKLFWRNESNQEVDFASVKPPSMATVELAMSASAWAELQVVDPALAKEIIENIKVYGRCTPYHKVDIVNNFVRAGYTTLMCGDGGNDSGALKTAHVGIALSDAEASIVAPFTSLDKDIGAVVEVLLEGRCALASAVASYKYILMYGMVETINQLINAYFLITFAEWCWVLMDGVWIITLSIAIPLAKAAKRLSPTRPTASVLGLQTLSSFLGVLLINFVFTVVALFYLFGQDWFQCRKWSGTDVSNVLVINDNFETQVIFLVTGYQYITSAIIWNFGYEFRQNWWNNYVLVVLVAVFTGIHFAITLKPGKLSCFFRMNCVNDDVFDGVFGAVPLQNDYNTTVMPADFRRGLAWIIASNFVAVLFWEYLVVNGVRQRHAMKTLQLKAGEESMLASKADADSGSEGEDVSDV